MKDAATRAPRLDANTRRARIIDAAMLLLARGGLEAASTTAIAREAGVTQSGVFKHFASKQEILGAVMDRIGDEIGRRIRLAASRPEPATQRVLYVVRAYLEALSAMPAATALLFAGEVQEEGSLSFLRDQITSRVGRLGAEIAVLLRDAQTNKSISGVLDTDAASLMVVAIAQGCLVRWHLGGRHTDVAAELDRIWPLCVQTLTGDTNPQGATTVGLP